MQGDAESWSQQHQGIIPEGEGASTSDSMDWALDRNWGL